MRHIVYRGIQRWRLENIDGRGVACLRVSFAAQHRGKRTDCTNIVTAILVITKAFCQLIYTKIKLAQVKPHMYGARHANSNVPWPTREAHLMQQL